MTIFKPSFNFPSGLIRLQAAVDMGHPAAQWQLAKFYAAGRFVDQNMALAEQYYALAAAGGLMEAQRDLAIHYSEYRNGVPQYEKAIPLFEAAAASGCGRSQLELGILYLYGRGVVQDLATAKSLLEKSAVSGSPTAKALLAYLKVTGTEAPAHPLAAFEMVSCLAKSGDGDAAVCVWHFHLAKFGHTSPPYGDALDILHAAALEGHPAAMRELGIHFMSVFSKEADQQINALHWLLKAGNADDAVAQMHIGHCFHDGLGTPADTERALHWLGKAAKNGSIEAEYNLATMAYKLPANSEEKAQTLAHLKGFRERGYNLATEFIANQLLVIAARDQLDAESILIAEKVAHTYPSIAAHLAGLYLGQPTTGFENKLLANFWLQMNAYTLDSHAMYRYGYYLLDGKIIDQNVNDGLALLNCAASMGNADAAAAIAYAYNYHPKIISNPRYAAAANEFAAKGGNAQGQHNFSLALKEGFGIEIKNAQADFWLSKYNETLINDEPSIVNKDFPSLRQKGNKLVAFNKGVRTT
jgi:TPR repeat protein